MTQYGEWLPHDIRDSRKFANTLCKQLQKDRYASIISGQNRIELRKDLLKEKLKISYDASHPLELYLNAIISREPLPASRPTRRTLNKLTLGLPSIRLELDRIPKSRKFRHISFEPASVELTCEPFHRNRFRDAISALEHLIYLSAIDKNCTGVIKGALMSYQIIKSPDSRQKFSRLIKKYKELSWYLVIQDSESEIITSVSDVMNMEVEDFEDIERRIVVLATSLNQYLRRFGSKIYVKKERNIIEGGEQGVFYREWCGILPPSESIKTKYHRGLDLVRFEELSDGTIATINEILKKDEKR